MIPDDFKFLCKSFYQGVEEIYPDAEQIVRAAVATLTDKQKLVVKDYLDELVSGKYDERQLWDIWEQAGAGFRITAGEKGQSAKFLNRIRTALVSKS